MAANFDVRLPDDVMPWKYRKLISNIGNVFQALVARNGDWRTMVTDAEDEARRVPMLDTAGIGIHRRRRGGCRAGRWLHDEAGTGRARRTSADQPGSRCSVARGTSKRTISTAKSR